MVHVQGLESLGISSEKYGSLLIPVILSRMPSEIALQVARKTSEDIWSIDDIMSMIQREIEAREVSYKISVQDVKKCEKPTKNLPVGTTKTFVTKSDKSKQSIECYFCNKTIIRAHVKRSLIQAKERRSLLLPKDATIACVLVTMPRNVVKHKNVITAMVGTTLLCVRVEQRQSLTHRLRHPALERKLKFCCGLPKRTHMGEIEARKFLLLSYLMVEARRPSFLKNCRRHWT